MVWQLIQRHPVLLTVFLVYGVNWLYCYLSCGKCKSQASMLGKTVIITGSNSGIGKATAFDLARRGARVILACRNIENAKIVKEQIVEATNNSNVLVQKLDVSCLSSVREFAEEINRSECRLDVLVHNAGVSLPGRRTTPEGLNLVMATNHFGPFLLTLLLIDLMKKTGSSRIIFVSSLLHRIGSVNANIANPVKMRSQLKQYSMSKFANVLFATELARRLEGSGVTANSLHPGVIYTPIWNECPGWTIFLLQLCRPFLKTEEQGAQTIVYLAVSEEVEGVSGKYFVDCQEATPSKRSQDKQLAKEYWEACEQIVQLKPSDPHI